MRLRRELLGRPFVVAEMLQLLAAGGDPEEDELMLVIENAFLERERQQEVNSIRPRRSLCLPNSSSEILWWK